MMSTVYLLLFFFAFVAFTLRFCYPRLSFSVFYGSLAIYSVLITSLREGIGTDYETYLYIYNSSPNLGDWLVGFPQLAIEPGFLFLNSIMKFFGLSVHAVFAICCVVNIINLKKASTNFGIDPYLVYSIYIFLYFISHNFNVVRHGMATSFIWLAFSHISNRNFKSFVKIILISSLFHYVSLLFLISYFVLNRNIGRKTIIISIIVSLLISLQYTTFIPDLLDKIFGGVAKYVYYKNVYFKNVGGESEYKIGIGILFNIVFLIILAISNFEKKVNRKYIVVYNAFYVSLLTLILLNSNVVFAERIGGVFYVSLIFLIPIVSKLYFSKPKIRLAFLFVLLIYSSLYYFKNLNVKEISGEYQYLPYKSIL